MPDYKQEMKKLLGQNSLTEKEIEIQQIYYSLSDGGKESIDKVINDVKNEADELRNFTIKEARILKDISDVLIRYCDGSNILKKLLVYFSLLFLAF